MLEPREDVMLKDVVDFNPRRGCLSRNRERFVSLAPRLALAYAGDQRLDRSQAVSRMWKVLAKYFPELPHPIGIEGLSLRFMTLARPKPRTLGLVGCGVQARVLIDAHRALFEGLELLLADASEAAAQALQKEKGGRVVSLQEASGADIVCTSTPVRSPVVKREWVRAGAHLNAMGADAQGKQELEARILLDGRIFIDDEEQALHSGEVNVPLHNGQLRESQIAGTLGEVVAGKKPGRQGDEITIFDSTGLAVQDVALAKALYEVARAKGVGQMFDLVGSG